MAQVYLDNGDSGFFIGNNNTNVFGQLGTESVIINTGVTGTILDQNVERVDLAGAPAAFTYQQAGNGLRVYSGATLIATIPIQGDADGTQVVFTTGSVQATLVGGVMTLGGTTVPSAAAAAVVPTTINPAITSGAGGTTPTTPTFSVSAPASVTEGGSATFTVTLSAPQTAATTVAYTLAGTGGAGLGTDTGTHVPAGNTGTLTFAAGVTTQTVVVPVTADSLAETGEGMTLTLSAPSTGTVVGTSSAAVAFADSLVPIVTASTVSGTTVVLEFNEALDPASIPLGSAFTVTQTLNGAVTNKTLAATDPVSVNNASVILTLATGIAAGSTVKVSYTPPTTNPLQDLDGNDALAVVGYAATVDVTAPTLSSSTPADNATAVVAGNNLTLTFSESIVVGTGNIVLTNSSNAADTRTISVLDTTQVSVSGSTVTINPTADLTAGASYDVSMAAGVVKDAIGNAFAGITTAGTLNFTVASSSTSTGATFNLTQGNDVVPGAIDNSGNDAINGFLDGGAPTFSALDVINGGQGTDTLTAYGLTGVVNLAKVTNVENFVFQTTGAFEYNFAQTAGELSVGVQNQVAAADANFINIEMPAAGSKLSVAGDTGGAGGTVTGFDFDPTAVGGQTDTVELTLNTVTGSVEIDNGTGTANSTGAVEVLNIMGTTGPSTLAALTLGAGFNKVTYAGDQNVSIIATALGAGITTIDASSATGNFSVQQANAITLAFTGGTGNDVLLVGDAGANISNADTLNGGDGIDTLMTTDDIDAGDLATTTNFEIFGMNGAIAQNWSLVSSAFANRASINNGAALTLTNILDGLVVDVNITGGTLNINSLLSDGAADDVTINLGTVAAGGIAAFTLGNPTNSFETVTINSQGPAANTLTALTGTTTNLTLTGGTGLVIANSTNVSGAVDGTAMTGALNVQVTSAAADQTVLGGSAGDTIVTGIVGANTQTISGNGGNDTLTTGALTVGGTINLNGGAGNDTLSSAAATNVVTTINHNGGTGNDTIILTGGGAAAVDNIISTATTVADADIVRDFLSAADTFDYNGGVVNGASATIAGNVLTQAAGTSLNSDFGLALAANTSATVYDLLFNLTGASATALDALANATNVTLGGLYTAFETELITAFAGAITGLDTVLGTTDAVLLHLIDGTDGVVLRVTNTDTSVANTLTAAEIELVGVFEDGLLVTADFV